MQEENNLPLDHTHFPLESVCDQINHSEIEHDVSTPVLAVVIRHAKRCCRGAVVQPLVSATAFDAVLAVSSLGLCTATCLLQAVSNWWCLRRVGRSGQYPGKVKNLAVPVGGSGLQKVNTTAVCCIGALRCSGIPVWRSRANRFHGGVCLLL